MDPRRFDDLLLEVYACPTEPSRWPHVLDRICHEMRARSAVLQLLVRDGKRAWSRWTVRDSASEAARIEHDRYMGDEVNPRMRISRNRGPRDSQRVVRDHDLFAPGDPRLAELTERLAAIELGPFMSVGMHFPADARLALVLHRDLRDRREFDPDDESFALTLLPHLTQAVRLRERIDAEQQRAQSYEDAINRVRCPLVLCDPDARVRWANSSAENLFARGNAIRVSDQRLITPSRPETMTLRRMIAQVARQDERARPKDRYLSLGHGAATELQVMMHPISGPDLSSFYNRSSQQRVLLVLSSRGEVPELPADLIGRVFALSPAESRVAAAMATGLTINEYASANGVTIGTARFQLKQVLAKTQASRQADLVRQICSSVIAYALPADAASAARS